MKTSMTHPVLIAALLVTTLMTLFAPNTFAQAGNLADANTYWCPMRGAPCGLDDYQGAGKCNDCRMPLVTKARYLERSKAIKENQMTLGVVLYDGFELLDVFGPMEMFAYAEQLKLVMIAEEAGPVNSGQGVIVIADYGFDNAPDLDIIMVPGGAGTFTELSNEAYLSFLQKRAPKAKITTSVCSGSALLAKAGILDGKRATSNKQFFTLATEQSDKVDWVWEARWVDDGNVITSSGVSAGMDMALHIIDRLFGTETAEAIAIGTEYEWHRDADVDPFAKLIKR